MRRGERAPTELESALTAYLVTVAEHGMNASTFTARVVASTQAGMVSSVVAALCALKGPLHGGAPGPVLDMLDAIGSPDRVVGWLDRELAAGRRLMGFGHRIYRVRDPRADVLKAVVATLRAGGNTRLAFAERVEAIALERLRHHKPDRPLDTNVEFYTALLLEAIGLDRELFTPVFAMGRVLGWTAHVLEQIHHGRLMRPQSRYVGPKGSVFVREAIGTPGVSTPWARLALSLGKCRLKNGPPVQGSEGRPKRGNSKLGSAF
jgi:citrate synthase